MVTRDKQNQEIGEILGSAFFMNSRIKDDFLIYISDLDYWKWVVGQYQKFIDSSENNMIVPKIIHQIWIGKKVPEKYKTWRASWLKNNPQFEYILWDERKILEFGLVNEKQFLNASNPGIKSDIARYEILCRCGGIYADTDFESLRPLDEKYLTRSFIAGQIFSYSPQAANGLMIAAPQSLVLRSVIESLPDYPGDLHPMEVLSYCGSFYLSRTIWNNRDLLSDIVVLPSQYFYPWPNFLMNSSESRYSYITNVTLAIHHWEMSWINRATSIGNMKRKLKTIIKNSIR